MVRRGQGAVEYLFMLAAGLVMVLVVMSVVFRVMRELTALVGKYISSVRAELLEGGS